MTPVTAQLRVLVIDDNVDGAEALGALVEAMGCLPAVAFGGADGIEAARRFEPHLALIDLEMPGMDGCKVAASLRASQPGAAATLVCVTGRNRPDDRRVCMEAGFDAFYTKPLSEEALTSLIASCQAAL